MDTLPVEIINEILLLIDRPSLFHTTTVCKQWHLLSLKQVKIITTEKDFYSACLLGDLLSINRSSKNKLWLNEKLKDGSRGRKELVELLIANIWNEGLFHGCKGGHEQIVELMIARGANKWNGGLSYSCQGGHKELVELMIAKGADNWNIGLFSSHRGGHKELVELMIAKGAHWNRGFNGEGHKNLVELMIAKGDDYNGGFYEACREGHKELIELMEFMQEKLVNHEKPM